VLLIDNTTLRLVYVNSLYVVKAYGTA
jgi:hypothetical protein